MTADDHQNLSDQTEEDKMVKKRHHPRKAFRLCVRMSHGEASKQYNARDISLGGIFVETSEKLAPGQKVKISLPFANQDRRIKMNGKVVRITNDGVGIQFDIFAIDIE